MFIVVYFFYRHIQHRLRATAIFGTRVLCKRFFCYLQKSPLPRIEEPREGTRMVFPPSPYAKAESGGQQQSGNRCIHCHARLTKGGCSCSRDVCDRCVEERKVCRRCSRRFTDSNSNNFHSELCWQCRYYQGRSV